MSLVPRRAIPRLNHDVLDLIMFMLRKPQCLFEHPPESGKSSCLLPLMNTCRALRELGVRHLLSSGVHITRYFKQESFHAFMFASPFTRFPHLRKIFIGPLHDCRIIVDILQRSHMLEVLNIQNCRPFIPEYARLGSAMNALRNLTQLQLRSADQRICDLLSRLGPRIQRLYLDGDIDSRGDSSRFLSVPAGRLLDVSRLLLPIAAELTTLQLGGSHLPIPPLRFPKVTRLSLDIYGAVNLLNVLSCFPILEELVTLWSGQGGWNAVDDVRKVCEPWASKGPWPSIRSLQCGVDELYALVISCKVEFIEFRRICYIDIPKMPIVLNQIMPTRLKLELIASDIPYIHTALPETLKNAPSSLQLLSVNLVIDQCETAVEMVVCTLCGPSTHPCSVTYLTYIRS